MPKNKSQHYVPRCHLRPFSLNQAGSAINLYNISRAKPIQNASLRDQCARDYIYGKDLQLERALQHGEGLYAEILRKLQHSKAPLTIDDLRIIRMFAFIQHLRTDRAMRRLQMLQQNFHSAVFEGRSIEPADIDLSDRTVMRQSIGMYVKNREVIEDLKICIVRNKSPHEFYTSDDPSVFTNKFYTQKVKSNVFGLSSSGIILCLPLSPSLLFMLYDGGVYTIPEKRGYELVIQRPRDVLALNLLQYLSAAKNIYFSNWEDRHRIKEEFLDARPGRLESSPNISVLVKDDSDSEGARWRRATESERTTADQILVAHSIHRSAPSKWLSKLKYRNPIRTHYNGSAVGHVRKLEWLHERPSSKGYNI